MQEEYKKTQILIQAREMAKAMSAGANNQSNPGLAAELEKLYELKQKGILSKCSFCFL